MQMLSIWFLCRFCQFIELWMLMSFVCICLHFASLCGCFWYCCCCYSYRWCVCCSQQCSHRYKHVCVCVCEVFLFSFACVEESIFRALWYIFTAFNSTWSNEKQRERQRARGRTVFYFCEKIILRVNCDQQLLLKNHSVWTHEAFCRPKFNTQ